MKLSIKAKNENFVSSISRENCKTSGFLATFFSISENTYDITRRYTVFQIVLNFRAKISQYQAQLSLQHEIVIDMTQIRSNNSLANDKWIKACMQIKVIDSQSFGSVIKL